MRKSVTQKHPMGCAVACTAYILNYTYQQALNLYENPQNAWKKGFYCRDIVMAMAKAGRTYRYKRTTTLKDGFLIESGTIVFIEKSEGYPAGHFLARTPESSWMNPWINFPSIAPAQSGFQINLPGTPLYTVFPTEIFT